MSEADRHSAAPATIDVLQALAVASTIAFSERLVERFQEWRFGASAHSVRAVHGDLCRFRDWARPLSEATVPARVEAVRDYLSALKYEGKSLATIERALSSISLAHRLAGVSDPTKDETVRWRMKGVRQDLAGGQRQAKPLRFSTGAVSVADMLALPARKLADLRNKALLSVAYDTGLRRAELVAIKTDHIRRVDDGYELFIPRIKRGFDGYRAFLTEETAVLIVNWIRAAGLADEMTDPDGELIANPLFRQVDRFDRVGDKALHPDTVGRIFKALAEAAARAAGLSDEQIAEAARVSAHSTRVGSTQDLFAANVEIGAICQARRWKSPRMVLRYTEALATQDSPVAAVLTSQRRSD